jgi:hypothetical protein
VRAEGAHERLVHGVAAALDVAQHGHSETQEAWVPLPVERLELVDHVRRAHLL